MPRQTTFSNMDQVYMYSLLYNSTCFNDLADCSSITAFRWESIGWGDVRLPENSSERVEEARLFCLVPSTHAQLALAACTLILVSGVPRCS